MSSRNLLSAPLKLPHSNPTRHGEFSPDGRFVLTAEEYGRSERLDLSDTLAHARLWNALDGTPASPLLIHRDEIIEAIAFSPDSQYFLTAGRGKRLRVYSTADCQLRDELKLKSSIVAACWSLDGESIVVACQNKTLSVISTKIGLQLQDTIKLKREPTEMCCSPDGRQLALVGGINVFIVDLKPLALRAVLTHRLRVSAITWRQPGRVLSGSDDFLIREWETQTGTQLREVFQTPKWIWSLQCSADGTKLLLGTEDEMVGSGHPGSGHAEIIDLDSGEPITPWFRHDGTVFAAFSPDESRVATGSADRTVSLWDVASGKQLGHSEYGWMVFGIRYSPQADRILAVGGSRNAALWNIAQSRQSARKK